VLDPVAPLTPQAAESEEAIRAQASAVREAMQREFDRLRAASSP
jgi:hypothetical protein